MTRRSRWRMRTVGGCLGALLFSAVVHAAGAISNTPSVPTLTGHRGPGFGTVHLARRVSLLVGRTTTTRQGSATLRLDSLTAVSSSLPAGCVLAPDASAAADGKRS